MLLKSDQTNKGLWGNKGCCSISMTYVKTRSRVCLWQWVGSFTIWQNPIQSSKALKAILRLSFSMSTLILKSRSMNTLSNFSTSSHKNLVSQKLILGARKTIQNEKKEYFLSFFNRIRDVECHAFKRTITHHFVIDDTLWIIGGLDCALWKLMSRWCRFIQSGNCFDPAKFLLKKKIYDQL